MAQLKKSLKKSLKKHKLKRKNKFGTKYVCNNLQKFIKEQLNEAIKEQQNEAKDDVITRIMYIYDVILNCFKENTEDVTKLKKDKKLLNAMSKNIFENNNHIQNYQRERDFYKWDKWFKKTVVELSLYNKNIIFNAIRYNKSDIVALLLKSGIDPNLRNQDDYTPLIDAVIHNHIEIIRLLLKEGVNPNLKSFAGKNALDYAHEIEDSDIIKLLESYMRRRPLEPFLQQMHKNKNKSKFPDIDLIKYLGSF
jgi:hypothetical protein